MSMIEVRWNSDLFNAALLQYAAAIEKDVEIVIKQVTYAAEGTIKQLTPVVTGTLRSSIHSRFPSPKTGIIATPVEYGPYVELGTVYFSGRHMFRRGLRKVQGQMIRRIVQKMKTAKA